MLSRYEIEAAETLRCAEQLSKGKKTTHFCFGECDPNSKHDCWQFVHALGCYMTLSVLGLPCMLKTTQIKQAKVIKKRLNNRIKKMKTPLTC